jgi:hypothetical protein
MQPFMGEHFALRSRMLPYEYLMGTSAFIQNPQDKKERFERLPEKEKQGILEDYRVLQEYARRPFLQKMERGIRVLVQEIPPFEQAWIFFSILISILILVKREGAKQAAWILPLITLAFIADNLLSGTSPLPSLDQKLIPTEAFIIDNYLLLPEGSQATKEDLEKGWKSYLIKNWSPQSQVEEGEYNFTLARMQSLKFQSISDWLPSYHQKMNPLIFLIFVGWNTFFAWKMHPLKKRVHL